MSSSLVDDVGRVLWHGFPGPEVTPELHAQIARGQIGAAIVFKRNLRVEAVAGPVKAAGIFDGETYDRELPARQQASLY